MGHEVLLYSILEIIKNKLSISAGAMIDQNW